MYEWHRLIQIVVDEIDEKIKSHDDEALTLQSLSMKLGYSEFHTTRRFKEISGMLLGDYIRLRKLAFALIEVRDTNDRFLNIAVKYGFGSHEAFTRAFKMVYGITPKKYRQNPLPVVLRTKISVFDRYFFGLGEIGMVKSTEDVKVYFITMPAHKFLHIKNYESNGYWDFWEKQKSIPGQDCDTICGLLDSIKGNLDSNDNEVGENGGQIMAYINDFNGKIFECYDAPRVECYGIRLPIDYEGNIPPQMHLIDIPEADYIVFEHGAFDYEQENSNVEKKMDIAISTFDYSNTAYSFDPSPGRMAYFCHDPTRFWKYIRPVIKK
jgi:AraC-like DNA-binding protein